MALLDLDGCTVTADALHCRPDMAAAILARGGHYVLALKNNRAKLLALARDALERGPVAHAETAAERGHDRVEKRRAAVAPLDADHGFPGLVAVGRIETRRTVAGRRQPPATRHYLLSAALPPERLLAVVRSHWEIENRLHWALDVALDEDRCRSRKDHGPQNLATLRKLALNLLRTLPDKLSLRRRIKRAGWDNSFLLSILAHLR